MFLQNLREENISESGILAAPFWYQNNLFMNRINHVNTK